MNALKWGTPARGGSTRIRPSGPFARRAAVVVLDTLRRVGVAPTHAPHSLGNAIIFIWGPNFEMLPAAHRTLGSTQALAGQTLLQRLFSFVASYRSRHVEEP